MSVAVISKTGERLMPTSEYRARKLLKSGKAIKYSYHPFTIQLTERKTGNIQPIELCMDTGYIHIGISVKSEKHEYLAEQIDTLTNERSRHDACRMYRRQRRNRKRYRQLRFSNRKKDKGWITPSLKHKKDVHVQAISRIIKVMAFVNTVKDFIDKSIKAFNKEQDKNIQLEAGARVVKNGKLYEYKDRIKGIAGCNKLESVYIPGDSLDFKIKTKKDDKDIFVDFHNCRLVSVEDGFITVTDGYKTVHQKPESLEGQQVRVPVETIMYSNAIEPSAKLRFSKKQCMDDFYAIMSDEEKAEFAETPIDALVEKWFSAVVDRTWIFRDEHEFRNPKKTTKKIIKKIKKKCQAEKSAKEMPEE